MKIKQIYYTEQQIEKLQKEADRIGIKVSELVRRIIDEYFASKEKTK
jgi:hypothetical protein